jgi:superfamily II DNA or RNA helicase/HKD family nuclease/predicted house-cleaning noncanonical NTP pyrophosphatase (MazG superfamily)
VFEKLIRDGIPALARADGRSIDTRTAHDHELDRLLGLKLVEEAHEALDAIVDGRRTGLLEELADLQTVIDAVAARKGLSRAQIDAAVLAKRAKRGGFEAGLILRSDTISRPRLHVGGATTLLDAIRTELQRCTAARLAVAFVMRSGTELLDGALRAALLRGADIRLLTTDYLDVTEPDALDALVDLQGRFEARVYSHERRSFHPKAYLFERADGSGRAFVGSANLSRSGLRDGVEWTWTVLDFDAGQPLFELRTRFDELWESEDVHPLSPGWIDAYRARRRIRAFTEPPPPAPPGIEPRAAQQLALRELERMRADGHRRALVVAATGLGKTFLAAFDARDALRVLFIAHREELLRQAAAAFAAVYPSRSVGFVGDGLAELDRDCVFASVQTLSRPAFLEQHDLSRFDYVVIDEFHHAGADSYLRLLEALSPRFLLGLTATPFRGDHRDLLELCDGNLAYQVGLFEAIALGWLVPFRYFGVADTVVYDDALLTARRTYDATRLTQRVNTPERAARAIERFREHDSRAALGFCVSIEHATFMAERFVAAGIPSAAVHSGAGSMDRTRAVQALTEGGLRVLFTVDLFNEGVDIPTVDLVMFLRPTESMTVFMQQLGRGLRLHPSKPSLTVLDFIGNYRNAHFKLPFLVGHDFDQELSPAAALKLLQRWQDQGARPTDLPEGIEVHIEPIAMEALRAAIGLASPLKQLVLDDLGELATRLGRAPTLTEWVRLGRYSLSTARTALGVDRWHAVLEAADSMDDASRALEAAAGDFLKEIETSAMTRSFKMVVLLALCDDEGFGQSLPISRLVIAFREYFAEDAHRTDVIGTPVEAVETADETVWSGYLLKNPIAAWTGANTAKPSMYFAHDSGAQTLRYIGPRPGGDAASRRRFVEGVRDRANARLRMYWQRPGPSRFVYPVVPLGHAGDAGEARNLCVMFGKDRAGLPEDWHPVRVGGTVYYGKFVKVALNVLKARPTDDRSEANVLTRSLRALFGGEVPPRAKVRFVKDAGANVWELLGV